jgi:hypothetical protein
VNDKIEFMVDLANPPFIVEDDGSGIELELFHAADQGM